MPDSPSGAPRFPGELRATLRQGRWILALSETAVSVFLLARGQSPAAWVTLCVLALYNALSILAVRRPVMPRLLVPAMLGLDLAFVLLAARLTGGAQSPFLGQSYLIILAAALWYDLIGGVAVGIAASVIAATAQYPFVPMHDMQIRVLGNLIPSYLLTGGFTGFLVRNLKSYYERDVAARLREQTAAQEMRLAREMQEASLPAGPPAVPGLECAFLTRFADGVGGDFLLFLTPESEKERELESETHALLGITIGDVSGKGISAALASTGIAHLLPWLHPLSDPARALRELNEDLNERLPGEYYATLIFAEVAADSLRLWTAGHPPALLWRSSEGRVVPWGALADTPLGLFPQWEGNPETVQWAVGDVLLLYTDGASETRSRAGQQFTDERISAALAVCADKPAAEIVQTIFQAVEAWGSPVDDLTLAVCKRVSLHQPDELTGALLPGAFP